MSYVGSSAAVIPVAFSGVNSQSFNGNGSTVAFTLNRPVSAVNAIEVMVNNVQQSPYDSSYSVSDTTLTFSAAPSTGTANIYVVYRDFPVGSITDTSAVQKTGDTMTGNLIVDANVGIGTISPTYKLTVQSGLYSILAGADSSATTLTDATQKVMRFGVPHYTNAEEPVGALFGSNTSTENNVLIGGGSGVFNAATLVSFYTATNTTTQTGSERMRITAAGNVGIGTSSPTSLLQVGSTASSNNTLTVASANNTAAQIDLLGDSSATFGINLKYEGNGNYFAVSLTNAGTLTERMRIDSAGRVTMPYQPAFNATRTAGSVFNAVVLWNSVSTNVGSHYSAATGRFTAPVAGNYFFSVGAICGSNTSGGSTGSLFLQINGQTVKDGHWNMTNDPWENVSINSVLTLSVSDYVQVYVSGSATAFMYGAGSYSNFNGYLLG